MAELLRGLLGALLVTGWLAGDARRSAAEDPPSSAAARRLVAKLSAEDFGTRELASEQLIQLGVAALPALQQGSRHPDREIRYRCARILAVIREADFQRRLESFAAGLDSAAEIGLPGWDPYHELVGDSEASRALFVEMQREDTELLRAIETSPNATAEALVRRLTEYSQVAPQVNHRIPLGRIAAPLFAATNERVHLNSQVASLIYSLCYQPSFQAGMESDAYRPILRKMLAAWIGRGDEWTIYQGLVLAQRYRLDEVLPVAERVLRDSTNPRHLRQNAVQLIASEGSAAHVPLLETLLADQTSCARSQINNVPHETQLRDMALAAIIHLLGEDPKQFGFQHFSWNPRDGLQVETVGFATAEERGKVFQKWRAFRQERPK